MSVNTDEQENCENAEEKGVPHPSMETVSCSQMDPREQDNERQIQRATLVTKDRLELVRLKSDTQQAAERKTKKSPEAATRPFIYTTRLRTSCSSISGQ